MKRSRFSVFAIAIAVVFASLSLFNVQAIAADQVTASSVSVSSPVAADHQIGVHKLEAIAASQAALVLTPVNSSLTRQMTASDAQSVTLTVATVAVEKSNWRSSFTSTI